MPHVISFRSTIIFSLISALALLAPTRVNSDEAGLFEDLEVVEDLEDFKHLEDLEDLDEGSKEGANWGQTGA